MVSAPEKIDRRYLAIGGAAELLTCREKEVLCESGAGTGKTHSLLRKADITARRWPKSRQFFARDTRVSMTESVLVEFEESVLWPGHPAIVGTAGRENRSHYVYPNGSEIIIAGLDNPDRIMSTQYDRGYIFEATETNEDQWEKLLTRIRNGRTDYHQLVGDVNPASEFHYLNQRFPKEGEPNPMPVWGKDPDTGADAIVSERRRIQYRHEDNPRLFDYDTGNATPYGRDYMATLDGLSGARKQRLLYHRWVSEEGQIWPQFEPAVHCIYRDQVPELRSYTASIDFGFARAGVLQVWGYDKDQNGYRIAEVKRNGWTIDQWADAAVALHKEFPYAVGVGDCARDDDIAFLNKRLHMERGEDFAFVKCDKSRGVTHGLDLVRDLLRRRVIFFVKDALRFGADPYLREKRWPLCTEQEIPSYVFRKNEDGKEIKEEPDPACHKDGCDATRYNAVYKYGKDFNEAPKRWAFPKPEPNTISVADAMDFLEVAEKEDW